MELLLTRPTLDGNEAARLGLVNAAVPAARLGDAARRLARAAAECVPAVVHAIKQAMAYAASASLQETLRCELALGQKLIKESMEH
jgi:enoyl-CoA hydratase/carnithine racemase